MSTTPFACPLNVVLKQQEREVLGAIPYNENTVILHRDASLMPQNRKTWASWNLLGKTQLGNQEPVCVSYWVNRLQV